MAFTPIGEFISLDRAIREYNYSKRSFYRLRENGQLQFHKLGHKNFIRRSDFECLMVEEPPRIPKEQLITTFL